MLEDGICVIGRYVIIAQLLGAGLFFFGCFLLLKSYLGYRDLQQKNIVDDEIKDMRYELEKKIVEEMNRRELEGEGVDDFNEVMEDEEAGDYCEENEIKYQEGNIEQAKA